MQGTSKEHKRTGSTSSKSCVELWSFRFGQGSCLGLGAAARKAQFESMGGYRIEILVLKPNLWYCRWYPSTALSQVGGTQTL